MSAIIMDKKKRIILPAVLCSLLLACDLWTLANRTPLTTDVNELLSTAATTPLDLTCNMLEGTRSGYCLFTADEEMVEEMAARLELDARIASLADRSTVPPIVTDGETGCLDPGIFGSVDGLPAYWLGGRPDQLSLADGSQFEYMLLLFNNATGQGCVQVAYAYG
jgi:hypothetical protein